MKIETKKSAVDLTELAMGILIVGIIVSIGTVVLLNFRDSRLTSLSTVSVSNDTVLLADDSGASQVSTAWFKSITSITNESGGETIAAENYTIAADSFGNGIITMASDSEYNATDLNVNYDYYNQSDTQWALPNSAALGLGEYGNWFTILVIVGIAAVILALIFLAFGSKGGIGSGGGVGAGVSY